MHELLYYTSPFRQMVLFGPVFSYTISFPIILWNFLSRLKIFAVDEYPGCIFSATLRPKKYATLDFYFFKCYLLRTHTQFYQLFMKHVWTFCSINTKLNWKKRLRDLEWRSIFALYSSHHRHCSAKLNSISLHKPIGSSSS